MSRNKCSFGVVVVVGRLRVRLIVIVKLFGGQASGSSQRVQCSEPGFESSSDHYCKVRCSAEHSK